MTASLPPVQPASAPSASPAAPSADNSADVPFSQVLSGEMAQQRGRAVNHAKAGDADKAADAQGRDAQTAEDARIGNPAADATVTLPPEAALPVDPTTLAAATTDTTTPDAAALLALAMNPDLQKADNARGLPAEGDGLAGSRVRGSGREWPGTAARARADAATLAADAQARAQGSARVGGDAASLAARTDPARAADAQPDFLSALNAQSGQTQASQAQMSQVQSLQVQSLQAQSAQAASLVATSQASDRLMPQLGTPAWNQALGDKIVWMAAGSQQSATLTLNPPDLGPLQVVLNVSNEQATAHFMAAQPEVRQALEAALPRLREMMQDAGIQLGQANVSADTPRQQDTQDRNPSRADGAFGNNDAAGESAGMTQPLPVRAGRGLVDTFA